jgi:type IV pilus assembly protein PilA
VRQRRASASLRAENGFTLIELMVVVLIVAILIAIAIPTFLGARSKAQDRAAQVALRQAFLTEKTFFTDRQTYAATSAELTALEPSLTFDSTIANTNQDTIGFTGTAASVVLALQSKSGAYFCIAEAGPGGTTYGSDATLTNVDQPAECAATSW